MVDGEKPFDADNHYYEAADAFTRHVPESMRARCVQWAEIDGRKHHVVAGKLARAVSNPTWNPIAKPGAIAEYLRGNPDRKDPRELMLQREPLPDCYMDRDARVAKVEEQGLSGIWLFPTLGVLYEELVKGDIEAVRTLFRGFNRWLDEDWGCNYRDTLFAAPYLPLGDVDFACEELEWALERDARVIVIRPAAVVTPDLGPISPAHPRLDPFWARVNEAGITVVIHAGDSGYTTHGYVRDGFSSAGFTSGPLRPNIKQLNIERAAYDFLLTISYERLFERFPNLRIASVENGAEFLPDLFRKLRQSRDRLAVFDYYSEDPGELFREHVWINPFWEDDVYEVESLMGPERVIFGSDWPHIEGMPSPLDYAAELERFDERTRVRILRDNARSLNERRPA